MAATNSSHQLSGRSGQGGDEGIPALRHACEHLRTHAHGSNPPARGALTRPEGNFLLQLLCAILRKPTTPTVSAPLTALFARQRKRCIVRPAQNPYRHSPSGEATPSCSLVLRPSHSGDVGISAVLQPGFASENAWSAHARIASNTRRRTTSRFRRSEKSSHDRHHRAPAPNRETRCLS